MTVENASGSHITHDKLGRLGKFPVLEEIHMPRRPCVHRSGLSMPVERPIRPIAVREVEVV